MKKFSAFVLLVLMSTYLFVSCVSKKQWQGKYTTVSYTKIEPREDFKVGSHIVVLYTPKIHDKKSDVIYRFDIMKDGKIVRRINFVDIVFFITSKRPEPNIGESERDYNYALVDANAEDLEKLGAFIFSKGETYKLYENLHDHEEIKGEVIDILLGRALLPEMKKND